MDDILLTSTTRELPTLSPDAAAALRDRQRRSLDEMVRLSVECTAQEQRIELEHTEALTRETAGFEKKARLAEQHHQRRIADLAASATRRQEAIRRHYEVQRQTLDASHQTSLQVIGRRREDSEAALKKQMEQACWQAESVLVAFEMRIDTEEQKAKEEEKASAAELAALASLESGAREALGRIRVEAFPVDAKWDDPLRQRLVTERKAVLAEHRQQSMSMLQELGELTQVRVADDLIPLFLIVGLAGIFGAVGWFVPQEDSARPLAGGLAALITVVVCVGAWLVFRAKKRARVRARAKAIYAALLQSLAIAREAARFDAEAAAASRDRRVKEARRKRDQEVTAAREEAKAQQSRAAEQYRTAMAVEKQRYTEQLAQIEGEKDRAREELERDRSQAGAQIERELRETLQTSQARHDAALQAIEAGYETQTRELAVRWDDGLRAVSEHLSVGCGDLRDLQDWNSPAWAQWEPPREFSGQVRFGEMKVDLAQLTEQVPRRLQLPGSFTVPAMLLLPSHASLLVESDHTGRSAGIALAQMVMARLLTQIPAGRVKFTLIDPVALGQSFAGFMHLADHDETLVGSRIWTEKDHIHQRLTDLTEHMETVIQKYLRNEYATIDQYNAQAGELAEPIRFLVIADFPTGFEQESLRRLSSIATTGPRCGVYTLILRDTRQALPPGSRMEEIIAHSVRLRYRNGAFSWDDAVFNRFPLRIDPPPEEKLLTRLMDAVGKAARQAQRVEVPFQSIAPRDDLFWSMSSKDDLRVPIGKTGATRLQSLRLGVGVAQHALVAGKTGSGKSNLMHTIITNLAMWYSPDEVEFYLVDFKKGVEFKAYAGSGLAHARAIAVESDREFGLSVLQRVDSELTRRGTLFRDAGVQEISVYRDRTGQSLPRCLLLIDEFQEFFSEDDKLSQEASGLMDRLVRQGRAFGVHLILGSQTIGGTSGLGRSTLGQIAVRLALQCNEADSQMILGDNNSAARLLSRPGEAIYNDAGGLVEANSPFQIAYLPEAQRHDYLERIGALARSRAVAFPEPIVFEGNSAAAIRKNPRLMALLRRATFPPAASAVPAYVGEPVAIKEPSAIAVRRQSGANVLMVGQQEESALAIVASMVASLAAQHHPEEALFYLMDGTPADSRHFGLLERVLTTIPHASRTIAWRQVPEAINELSGMLNLRRGDEAQAGRAVYLLVFGLQRYRLLRRQEDDFSFGRGEEAASARPEKQFAELLSEGPALGVHTFVWADTPITLERTLDRASMRQFDHRILFQMSASDSSNLIDSPLANRLGEHRALLYSEEQGTIEKFRPYEVPDDAWLEFLRDHLKNRSSTP